MWARFELGDIRILIRAVPYTIQPAAPTVESESKPVPVVAICHVSSVRLCCNFGLDEGLGVSLFSGLLDSKFNSITTINKIYCQSSSKAARAIFQWGVWTFVYRGHPSAGELLCG